MREWKVEEGQVDQINVNAIQPFVPLLKNLWCIKFLFTKVALTWIIPNLNSNKITIALKFSKS